MNNEFGMDAALRGLKERGYTPNVVYDIGAAVGGWTSHALKYWPNVKYLCFEPLSERKRDLEEFKKKHENVEIHACGLADIDGEMPIGVGENLWESSFAYPASSNRAAPVYKLDTLIDRGLPLPSFMKLDVQGFELRVLNGGRRATQAADLVLLECQFFAFCQDMRTLDKTIAYMSERELVPYEIVEFMRRPLDGAMGQCDILFIKREHPLVSQKRWC